MAAHASVQHTDAHPVDERRAGVPRASRQDGTYPRPQLVRARHVALDRRVGFAHDDADAGLAQHWERDDARFDRTIQLPFAPESAASGIAETGYHPYVWYRIPVTPADLAETGYRPGLRLLLHFGAVDHEAIVFVDGQRVGEHVGGQTAFHLDITDALGAEPGAREHVVVVRAADDPLDTRLPRGKQDWQEDPHAIWYHRTTGIWRTVWLEAVPPLHIDRLTWVTDVTHLQVRAHVELNRRPRTPAALRLDLSYEDLAVASVTASVSGRSVEVVADLSTIDEAAMRDDLLWAPQHPTLFDARLTLEADGQEPDEIASYLGVRDVRAGRDRLLVNFEPVTLRAVLEQGFWPESGFTPPSTEAMRAEVQLVLDLGLNCARIHQKVEDPRLLYWADRLGLMLWGETAAAYNFDSRAVQLLSTEWIEIVRANASHPSIVAWVPFNESWGVLQVARDGAQQAYVRGLTDLTRALDPTRPVISNDGWEHANSDLLTIHDYDWRHDALRERYSPEGLAHLERTLGPAGRSLSAGERQRLDVPVLLTEIGGVRYVTEPSAETMWGYSSATDADDYERRIRAIIEPVKESPVVGGYCWTQLTDTLQEANGLCDEHRRPKLPVETLRSLLGA